MLTILEAAQLSAHTYHPDKPKSFFILIDSFSKEMLKKKKQLLNWCIVTDGNNAMQSTTRVYFGAQLYLKFKNGRADAAVIAFRGTCNWHNDMVDAVSWYNDAMLIHKKETLPYYMPPMLTYVHGARRYLRELFGVQQPPLFFTGHSLGGAMAKLAVVESGIAKTAITFNAPGVANMPSVKPELAHYLNDINVRYDIVHALGGLLPHEHQAVIDVPEYEQDAKALFTKFNLKTYSNDHSLIARAEYLTSLVSGVVKQTSAWHDAYTQCDHNDMQFGIADESDHLPTAACHELVLSKAEATIFMAQHKINNIIQALNTSAYSALAHRGFLQ